MQMQTLSAHGMPYIQKVKNYLFICLFIEKAN